MPKTSLDSSHSRRIPRIACGATWNSLDTSSCASSSQPRSLEVSSAAWRCSGVQYICWSRPFKKAWVCSQGFLFKEKSGLRCDGYKSWNSFLHFIPVWLKPKNHPISIHLHPLRPKVSWCSASKWMICQRNMRWSAPASSSWRLAREPGTGPATVPTMVPWYHGRIAIQLDGNCMKEVLGCFI